MCFTPHPSAAALAYSRNAVIVMADAYHNYVAYA